MAESMTATQLRSNLNEVLQDAANGIATTITYHGIPVARIVPAEVCADHGSGTGHQQVPVVQA